MELNLESLEDLDPKVKLGIGAGAAVIVLLVGFFIYTQFFGTRVVKDEPNLDYGLSGGYGTEAAGGVRDPSKGMKSANSESGLNFDIPPAPDQGGGMNYGLSSSPGGAGGGPALNYSLPSAPAGSSGPALNYGLPSGPMPGYGGPPPAYGGGAPGYGGGAPAPSAPPSDDLPPSTQLVR